jgi:hypothetical protein
MVYTLNVTLRGVTAIFTWWAETSDIAASARDGDRETHESATILCLGSSTEAYAIPQIPRRLPGSRASHSHFQHLNRADSEFSVASASKLEFRIQAADIQSFVDGSIEVRLKNRNAINAMVPARSWRHT